MNRIFILAFLVAIAFYSFDTAPASATVKQSEVTEATKTDTSQSIGDGLIYSLDSNKFDFGVIANYEWISVAFYAKNASNRAIEIQRASTCCGCDYMEISKRIIGPGETIKIVYKYDSHRIGVSIKTGHIQYGEHADILRFHCNVQNEIAHDEYCYNHIPMYSVEKPFYPPVIKELSLD